MHGSPPSKGCHPDDYRVDFFELLKRIDGSLQCDEQFFENEHGSAQSITISFLMLGYACNVEESQLRKSLNMSCLVVNTIDHQFPANVDPGSPTWNKANERPLLILKFGSLERFVQNACFLHGIKT